MCATQYRNNLCENNPVPAMIQQCASWKTCMDRDPTMVGRARVGAELIADVINGFVEPISWKTLVSTRETADQFAMLITYLCIGFYVDVANIFDGVCEFVILPVPVTPRSCTFTAKVSSSPYGTVSSSLPCFWAHTSWF
jgi:hypothetical protein